jgi:hypothetical protein
MLNLNNLGHKSTVSAFHEGADRPLGGLFVSHYNPRISLGKWQRSAAIAASWPTTVARKNYVRQ